jgi:hypothetical protein
MTTLGAKHTPRKRARTQCKRCGNRIPPTARKHGDPFCSRVCAEATYGTPRSKLVLRLPLPAPRTNVSDGGRAILHGLLRPTSTPRSADKG